jgi:hypothetical protein
MPPITAAPHPNSTSVNVPMNSAIDFFMTFPLRRRRARFAADITPESHATTASEADTQGKKAPRPDPKVSQRQLARAALFGAHQIEGKTELTGHNYWALIRRRPFVLVGRQLGRLVVLFLGWSAWKRSMRKPYWLAHPYKMAAVVGRKIAVC